MAEFTGLWISAAILALELPITEAAILSIIFNLQPFRASNGYIAKILNISARTVIRKIIELEKLGYIKIEGSTSARIIKTTDKMSQAIDSNLCQTVTSTYDNMSHTYDNMSKTGDNLSHNIKDIKNKKDDIKDNSKSSEKKPAKKTRTTADTTHPILDVPMNLKRYENLCADYGQSLVDENIQAAIDYKAKEGLKPYSDFAAAAAGYIRRAGIKKIEQPEPVEIPEFLKQEVY